MKKIFSTILILTFIPVMWAAVLSQNKIPPAQQKTIEEEIFKVHEEMKKAAENFNADELFKYVLDVNDVIIENGSLRPTRREALNITRQGFQGINELSYIYNHKNITVISSDTALWTGKGTTNAVLDDGRNLINDFAETIVFVLRDGQWKVLHAHRSTPNSN